MWREAKDEGITRIIVSIYFTPCTCTDGARSCGVFSEHCEGEGAEGDVIMWRCCLCSPSIVSFVNLFFFFLFVLFFFFWRF